MSSGSEKELFMKVSDGNRRPIKMGCSGDRFTLANRITVKRVSFGILIVVLLGTFIAGTFYRIERMDNNIERTTRTRKSSGALSPWLDMRLPLWIIPSAYNIELDINMDDDSYKGNVDINITVTRNVNVIIFHAVDLHLVTIEITDSKSAGRVKVVDQFPYKPNEFYVVKTKSYLEKHGNYSIHIEFTGTMRYDLSGLYTSNYTDGNRTKKIASTFFSPISARKAFPCFDEPLFKANFTLSLRHSRQYHALSNMPVQAVSYKGKTVHTKFLPTLKMSTYILCWVISELKGVEKENFTRPRIKAWTTETKIKDVDYGVDMTGKLLRFYEDYFNISYPLEKLDIVAIPNLGAGAMENWGLITYRSHIILINDKSSSEEDRMISLNVMAHELVHQWFGNLVTMEFWTDLWLKEGFADNFAVFGGDKVDKEMRLKDRALNYLMLPALEIDAYSTSHPISTVAKTPNEIHELFDVITYQKGSCIVGMLKQYLGEDSLQKGLQNFLKLHAYGNANQDDLWRQLSLVGGKEVKSVMDTWTLQLGYPLISVTRINQSSVMIEQKRFSLDPPDRVPPKSPFDYLWKVPIIFMSPDDKSRKVYLLEKETVTLEVPNEYLIANPDHSLFYRVFYDEASMKRIRRILMKSPAVFSAQDRTGIVSDQFNFVTANLTTISDTLDLLEYMKKETDYYPWETAFKELRHVSLLIESNVTKAKFNGFLQGLMKGILDQVEWARAESQNRGYLQVLLLRQACEIDSAEAVNEADRYYRNWMEGKGINLRASLHRVVRDCAISHGPHFYWDYAFQKYKDGGPEKDSIMMSLTATRNVTTIQRLLMHTLDSNTVASQDAPGIIGDLASRSTIGRRLCWIFIKQNWNKISVTYANELFLLASMLSSVLDNFSSEEDLADIQTFFEDKVNIGSGQQALKQSINKIRANIRWKNMHLDNLSQWLIRRGH